MDRQGLAVVSVLFFLVAVAQEFQEPPEVPEEEGGYIFIAQRLIFLNVGY